MPALSQLVSSVEMDSQRALGDPPGATGVPTPVRPTGPVPAPAEAHPLHSPTLAPSPDIAQPTPAAKLLLKAYPMYAPPVQDSKQLLEDLEVALKMSYLSLDENYDPEYVCYGPGKRRLLKIIFRFIEKLPQTLNAVVQTLSRATGAVIHTMAIWESDREITDVYEYVSNFFDATGRAQSDIQNLYRARIWLPS